MPEDHQDRGEQEQAQPLFPLKRGGGPSDVALTRIFEQHVRRLLEEDPALFQSLRSLVEGREDEVSYYQIKKLRSGLFLDSDLTVLPGIRAIVEACYRETPDGPCIVDPFDVRTPDDANRLKEAEVSNANRYRQFDIKLLQTLRDKEAYKQLRHELLEDDKEDGKGRPRRGPTGKS